MKHLKLFEENWREKWRSEVPGDDITVHRDYNYSMANGQPKDLFENRYREIILDAIKQGVNTWFGLEYVILVTDGPDEPDGGEAASVIIKELTGLDKPKRFVELGEWYADDDDRVKLERWFDNEIKNFERDFPNYKPRV